MSSKIEIAERWESRRKQAAIAVTLICLLLIGAGFTVYFYQKWAVASARLAEAELESQMAQSILQAVNSTAPKASMNLTFVPTPPERTVAPDSVTFLTGYVRVFNMSGLVYPATLNVNFTVSYRIVNGNATILYSFIPTQTVYLAQGVSYVEVPWGLFPLEIHGKAGTHIIIEVTARVTITWTYVGAVMADQSVAGHYHIYISEAG